MNKYNNEDSGEKETASGMPPQWQTKLCNLVVDEWNKGDEYVDDLNDVYEDIYKMIRGERPEKNYDWQSNVVINKVFQVVWTAIPYISQKIFGANPIVAVQSFDKKGAWQREAILEFWRTMQPGNPDHIPYFLVTVMWLLRALLNGVGFLKKGWHQKLKTTTKKISTDVPMEMDGAGNVIRSEPFEKTFRNTIPIEDWPYGEVVNNKDVRVDWLLQPGQSVRAGRFIVHRAMIDLDSLYSSDIDYMNLDRINAEISTADSNLRQEHSELTQMDGQGTVPDSDIYAEREIYERQGKLPVYKKKQDGEWVPCFDKEEIYDSDDVVFKEMIVAVDITGGKDKYILIRCESNPYGEKTWLDMHIYLDAERWQSMGMVEPFKDVQTALNDNINAMFDEINQNLMPPAIFDKLGFWDWDTIQYAPGQKWMVMGDPTNKVMFKEPSNITGDAWKKHLLLDSEIQLTSAVTPPMQGVGKEKAATTNVLNAQMSAGKLDFIVKMVETTGLIPDAQMDVRFAKKFAHRMTFQAILGQPFQYSEWEEIYKYIPAAGSVKLEHQKEAEIQQDTQLMQIVAMVPNPGVPKILNMLLANILRNKGWPKEAAMFDEDFYEPSSDAGNMQMLDKMMGGNVPSNQNQLPMTTPEKNVRRQSYGPGQ